MLVDALGNPVDVRLTPGQAHDLTCATPLLEEADPEALIGDKAYDADPLLDMLAQRDITPVIPPKANRKTPRNCDFALYCERNLVERFFNKLKHFAPSPSLRHIAGNFLGSPSARCAINRTGAAMEDDMAVDMVLWALLAAMVGFLALGCMVTRKTIDGR